jgi:hypothetical protein
MLVGISPECAWHCRAMRTERGAGRRALELGGLDASVGVSLNRVIKDRCVGRPYPAAAKACGLERTGVSMYLALHWQDASDTPCGRVSLYPLRTRRGEWPPCGPSFDHNESRGRFHQETWGFFRR